MILLLIATIASPIISYLREEDDSSEIKIAYYVCAGLHGLYPYMAINAAAIYQYKLLELAKSQAATRYFQKTADATTAEELNERSKTIIAVSAYV